MARSASVCRRPYEVTLPPQSVPFRILHDAVQRESQKQEPCQNNTTSTSCSAREDYSERSTGTTPRQDYSLNPTSNTPQQDYSLRPTSRDYDSSSAVPSRAVDRDKHFQLDNVSQSKASPNGHTSDPSAPHMKASQSAATRDIAPYHGEPKNPTSRHAEFYDAHSHFPRSPREPTQKYVVEPSSNGYVHADDRHGGNPLYANHKGSFSSGYSKPCEYQYESQHPQGHQNECNPPYFKPRYPTSGKELSSPSPDHYNRDPLYTYNNNYYYNTPQESGPVGSSCFPTHDNTVYHKGDRSTMHCRDQPTLTERKRSSEVNAQDDFPLTTYLYPHVESNPQWDCTSKNVPLRRRHLCENGQLLRQRPGIGRYDESPCIQDNTASFPPYGRSSFYGNPPSHCPRSISYATNRTSMVPSYIAIVCHPIIDSFAFLDHILKDDKVSQGPLGCVQLVSSHNPLDHIPTCTRAVEKYIRETTCPCIVVDGFLTSVEKCSMIYNLLGLPQLVLIFTLSQRQVLRQLFISKTCSSEDDMTKLSQSAYAFDLVLPDLVYYFKSKVAIKMIDFSKEPFDRLTTTIKNILIKFMVPAGQTNPENNAFRPNTYTY